MVLPAEEREKIMKVFITKYAMTKGILEMDGERCTSSGLPSMIEVAPKNSIPQYYYVEGGDWHQSRESAVKRANEMQSAKLKSIDKQRKRIAALTFE